MLVAETHGHKTHTHTVRRPTGAHACTAEQGHTCQSNVHNRLAHDDGLAHDDRLAVHGRSGGRNPQADGHPEAHAPVGVVVVRVVVVRVVEMRVVVTVRVVVEGVVCRTKRVSASQSHTQHSTTKHDTPQKVRSSVARVTCSQASAEQGGHGVAASQGSSDVRCGMLPGCGRSRGGEGRRCGDK